MDEYQGKRVRKDPVAEAQTALRKSHPVKWFIKEWGGVIALLAAIFILGRVVFQIAVVPSGSMEPTIPTKTLQICWRLPYVLSDPTPQRGDVLTFWSEEHNEIMVKRVIGLPGETVSFLDGYTYINGVKLDEPYLPSQGITVSDSAFEVPEGCIFFMGDNRTGSWDARFWGNPYISYHDVQARVLLTISIGSGHSWTGIRIMNR